MPTCTSQPAASRAATSVGRAQAAGHGQAGAAGRGDQVPDQVGVQTRHPAFALHEGHEEAAAQPAQLGHARRRRRGRCRGSSPRSPPRRRGRPGPRSPARGGSRAQQLRRGGGADDDPLGAGVEPAARRGRAVRMPPPTRQRAVRSSGAMSAALSPVPRAASRSMTAISPTRPKRAARGAGSPASRARSRPPTSCTVRPLLQIDAGDDHGRTSTPRAASSRLRSATVPDAVVEDARRQHRVRTRGHGGGHVPGRGAAARGDDGHAHHGPHRGDQLPGRSRRRCRRGPSW